jgi:RecJ-like exonuclease
MIPPVMRCESCDGIGAIGRGGAIVSCRRCNGKGYIVGATVHACRSCGVLHVTLTEETVCRSCGARPGFWAALVAMVVRRARVWWRLRSEP